MKFSDNRNLQLFVAVSFSLVPEPGVLVKYDAFVYSKIKNVSKKNAPALVCSERSFKEGERRGKEGIPFVTRREQESV